MSEKSDERRPDWDLLERQSAVISDVIRIEKARAWHEGYWAGWDARRLEVDEHAENPYREER